METQIVFQRIWVQRKLMQTQQHGPSKHYVPAKKIWGNMKVLRCTTFLLLFIAISSVAQSVEVEQKMIIVKGDKSFLMEGDSYKNAANKPKGYSKDSVLPAFLSIGWQIKSVRINEKSTEDNLYGYVVIERVIK